jgi:hypothetical protein
MKKPLAAVCLAVMLAASQVANATTISLNVGAGGAPGDRILGEAFVPIDVPGDCSLATR